MVGYSLMHSALGVVLLLATLASLLWPIAVLITALFKRTLGGTWALSLLAIYAVGWGLLYVPYGFWQRAFIWKFTPMQATALMTSAAAKGDLTTVRAFLERGVPIDAQARNGTALHGAAVAGQIEVMDFLLAHGANANAINPFGDSPLTNARSVKAQALLKSHGGERIEGTQEQRNRAIENELREDSERLRAKIDNTTLETFRASWEEVNSQLNPMEQLKLTFAAFRIAMAGYSSAEDVPDSLNSFSVEAIRGKIDGLTYSDIIRLADKSSPTVEVLKPCDSDFPPTAPCTK